MEAEERWAYRARPKELGGPLREVEIVRVGGPGKSGWIHVRFFDGDDSGLQEWVNPTSLVAPWADADVFRKDDAGELALAEASRHVRGTVDFDTSASNATGIRGASGREQGPVQDPGA